MKRSRFTEEQIIAVLKEHAAGTPAKELCRRQPERAPPLARPKVESQRRRRRGWSGS